MRMRRAEIFLIRPDRFVSSVFAGCYIWKIVGHGPDIQRRCRPVRLPFSQTFFLKSEVDILNHFLCPLFLGVIGNKFFPFIGERVSSSEIFCSMASRYGFMFVLSHSQSCGVRSRSLTSFRCILESGPGNILSRLPFQHRAGSRGHFQGFSDPLRRQQRCRLP